MAHWIETTPTLGAYWKHDGNPKRPHALLTAKLDGRDHSDFFFSWGMIAQDPYKSARAARELANKISIWFVHHAPEHRHLHRVVGPGYGAITLADRLSQGLSQPGFSPVLHGFTEKTADGIMLVRLAQSGEVVLPCEDTITSGGSVLRSIEALQKAGCSLVPIVACICNRSGLTHIGDFEIISLVAAEAHSWTAEECPLCKAGSEAVPPKKPAENWTRLNADYN